MIKKLREPRQFFFWLYKILYWIVSSRTTSENVVEELALEKNRPVVYVLPKSSFINVLVLYYHCKKLGLPLPTSRNIDELNSNQAYYFSMKKSGLFQTRQSHNDSKKLTKLVEQSQPQKKNQPQPPIL